MHGRPCPNCGGEAAATATYCSRRCAGAAGNRASRARLLQTREDRFWLLVDKSAGPAACWPWRGRLSDEGYGRKKIGSRCIAAHRVAMLYSGIDLPADRVACHRCDNRSCCNPSHLFIGTPADNVADCIAKGRFPSGERAGSAKISAKTALAIRNDGRTQIQIAAHYGVSQSLVSAIKTGLRWKDAA